MNPVLGGAGSNKATVRYSSGKIFMLKGQSERRNRVAKENLGGAVFYLGDPNAFYKVFKKP